MRDTPGDRVTVQTAKRSQSHLFQGMPRRNWGQIRIFPYPPACATCEAIPAYAAASLMCLFKKVSRLLVLFAMSEGKTKAFLFGLHRSKSKPGRGSPFTASSSCAPAQSSPYWRQAIGFTPLKSLSKRKLNQTCAHTVRALVRPKAAHAKLAALCFAVAVNGLGAKLTLAEKRRLTRPWIADWPVASCSRQTLGHFTFRDLICWAA